MFFSFDERKAVYCIARAMVFADGNLAENEMKVLTGEMLRIGSTPDELIGFENTLKSYQPAEAVARISNLSTEKKEYFCAFLGALIIVDGKVDDNEMKLWAMTSHICGLPTMSVGDAVEYMAKL